jgi:predicted ATPase/Tfp pilus assembly protein PilF
LNTARSWRGCCGRPEEGSAFGLLTDWYEKAGEFSQAEAYTRRQLELEPWLEEAHCQLMRLLALQGKRSQALAQYELVCKVLKAELGVQPSPETIRLYEHIRDGKLTSHPHSELTDIVPAAPENPRHNLPNRLTSFIGREKEIIQLLELFEQHRLVTLIGAGGVGKTRLAIQVAEQIVERVPDGVWFVELAPIADPALVVSVVARAVGMYVDSGTQAQEALLAYLKTRHMLIILDNCEHLVEACGRLVEPLLQQCPRLSLLATSREVLGIPGEAIYYVPSLSIPDCDSVIEIDILTHSESVRLFVERAAAVQSGFELTPHNAQAIKKLCAQLDGIPLALELAAARANLLPVEQISRRLAENLDILRGELRTALPRHQTLRGCLDWSYGLLALSEQALLQALSIFAGGWTLEAAEAVCVESCTFSMEVLDLVGQLASKSLVIIDHLSEQEVRYRLLETVRYYAQEKLTASARSEAIRDRHLAYYRGLAEQAEPQLRGPQQVVWSRRLEAELPNFRSALDWACNEDGPLERLEDGLRLGSALLWFWHQRLRHEEGFLWLERLLDMERHRRGGEPLSASMHRVRAKVLKAAGYLKPLIRSHVDYDAKALAFLEEAQTLFQQLGPAGRRDLEFVHLCLIRIRYMYKPYLPEEIIKSLEEVYEEYKELDDKFGMGEVLFRLGLLYRYNHYDLGMKKLEESLQLRQEIGDLDGIAYVWSAIAHSAAIFGNDLIKAKACIDTAAQKLKELEGINLNVSLAFHSFRAEIAWKMGDYALAETDFQAAQSIEMRQMGFAQFSSFMTLGFLALLRGDYAKSRQIYNEQLIVAHQHRNMDEIADSLNGLGVVAWVEGKWAEAAGWFNQILKLDANRRYKASAANDLAMTAFMQKDSALAVRNLSQAITYLKGTEFWYEQLRAAEIVAIVAVSRNCMAAAAQLLSSANLSYQIDKHAFLPFHRQLVEDAVVTCRAALDELTFNTAWEVGKGFTPDQALEYASQVVEELQSQLSLQ